MCGNEYPSIQRFISMPLIVGDNWLERTQCRARISHCTAINSYYCAHLPMPAQTGVDAMSSIDRPQQMHITRRIWHAKSLPHTTTRANRGIFPRKQKIRTHHPPRLTSVELNQLKFRNTSSPTRRELSPQKGMSRSFSAVLLPLIPSRTERNVRRLLLSGHWAANPLRFEFVIAAEEPER